MDTIDTLITSTTESPSFFAEVLEKMENFPVKISFFFGVSIVLGSVVPYIPQYFTIHQTQNTEGFSLYVCLTLLVANVLRIIFWFGNNYETPLLIQSIVMIVAMFALLELCVRVRNANLILQKRKKYFAGQNGENAEETGSGHNSSLDMNVDEEKIQVKFSDSSKDSSVILNSASRLESSDSRQPEASNETILNVPSLPSSPLDTSSNGNNKNYSSIPPPTDEELSASIPAHTFKTEKSVENKDCYIREDDGPKSDVGLLNQELNNNSSNSNDQHAVVVVDTKHSINATFEDDDDNKESVKIVTNSATIPDDWPEKRHFMDFNWRYFWEWTDFISYIECMVAFAFSAGLVMYMFIDNKLVIEGFGFAALVTESLLASPQFYRNYKSKSTEGMSRAMVFTWFIGDLYKTIYFIVRDTPVQFWVCGITQITFDILIFVQLFIYRKPNYKKLAKTRAQNQGKEEKSLLDNPDGRPESRKGSKLPSSGSKSPILSNEEANELEPGVEMGVIKRHSDQLSSNAFVNSEFDIVTEFRPEHSSESSSEPN